MFGNESNALLVVGLGRMARRLRNSRSRTCLLPRAEPTSPPGQASARPGAPLPREEGTARGAGLGWEAQRVGGALVQIRNEPQGRPGPAREHARPRRRKRAALTTQTEAPVGMRFGRNIDDPARARPSQTASRSISVTPSETPIGLRLRAQYRSAQCRRRYTPTTTPRICVLRQSFLGMRIGAMSLFAGCNRTCSRSG